MPPLKPELSDGYVRIVNELFEALYRTPMPSRHKDVVLLIIRYRYGWNRKEAKLSMGKIVIELNMDRANVNRAIKSLEAAKIIYVVRTDYRSKSTYCIN